MKKIYNFNNGVVYPTRDKLRVRSRLGRSILKFVKEADKYILKKICIKNVYRYPCVEFEDKEYELISINDDIKNVRKYINDYLKEGGRN